ncbi:MAG: hypothetical protein C4338_01540 [Rhodanobacteraceae bacterium]
MRNRSFLLAAGGLLLFAAGRLFADGGTDPPAPSNISNAQDLAQQATCVRVALQPGGEYANLSARDRDLVMRAIDFMTALMQRRGSIESMSGRERVAMFNAQSEADRLLSGNSLDAVTCAYEPQTGSHLPSALCWASDGI